jgi:hypothetical protein
VGKPAHCHPGLRRTLRACVCVCVCVCVCGACVYVCVHVCGAAEPSRRQGKTSPTPCSAQHEGRSAPLSRTDGGTPTQALAIAGEQRISWEATKPTRRLGARAHAGHGRRYRFRTHSIPTGYGPPPRTCATLMKNCDPFELGTPVLAIDSVPCGVRSLAQPVRTRPARHGPSVRVG